MRLLGSTPATGWKVSKELVDMTRSAPQPKPIRMAAQPQPIQLDLARTALIVIDMQNDFCSPGGYIDNLGFDCKAGQAPIAPLNRLLPELRRAGVPVIWVNWGNRSDRRNLPPNLLHAFNPFGEGTGIGDPLPKGGHKVLEKGSWAASIVDGLEHDPSKDIYVHKYRMSGFWDTPLDSILRQLGVTTLLFGGINADQCVLCTLQDASCLGYDSILLEDCAATSSPPFCWEATLFNVRLCFGFTSTSSTLLEAVAAPRTP